ncbi:MAG TPA: hypothetical protein VHS58_09440 [Acetobacteraceae bacterium]|nr:hypothetical protein [Acetobacteraceae bacterium]
MQTDHPLSIAEQLSRIIDGLIAAVAAESFLASALLFFLRPRLKRMSREFAALIMSIEHAAALTRPPADVAVAPDQPAPAEPPAVAEPAPADPVEPPRADRRRPRPAGRARRVIRPLSRANARTRASRAASASRPRRRTRAASRAFRVARPGARRASCRTATARCRRA